MLCNDFVEYFPNTAGPCKRSESLQAVMIGHQLCGSDTLSSSMYVVPISRSELSGGHWSLVVRRYHLAMPF